MSDVQAAVTAPTSENHVIVVDVDVDVDVGAAETIETKDTKETKITDEVVAESDANAEVKRARNDDAKYKQMFEAMDFTTLATTVGVPHDENVILHGMWWATQRCLESKIALMKNCNEDRLKATYDLYLAIQEFMRAYKAFSECKE